jgi:hypothetical protein
LHILQVGYSLPLRIPYNENDSWRLMKLRFNAAMCFALLGFTCLVLPNASKADSFDWSYQGTLPAGSSGLLNLGSGELTTTDGVITELSGTFDGLAIASLLAPGAFAGNDNLLLIPAAPWYLTTDGFSFLDSTGAEFNIYGGVVLTGCTCGPSGCFDCTSSNIYASTNFDSSIADSGNFTVTPIATTPEPSIMAMLLPVALGFALFLARKRIQAKLSAASTPASCSC